MNSLLVNGLSDDELLVIEREAKDFALINGIAFKSRTASETDGLSLSPVTLFPSTFSRQLFSDAKCIQPVINKLLHDVAYNQQFLTQSLERTIRVDDFTNRLHEIYTQVMREGLAQSLSLGLFRADYMMNQIDDRPDHHNLKQVEVNVISASFGGLAPKVRSLHKHVLSKYSEITNLENRLPVNESTNKLALALVKAWHSYNQSNAAILIMVEANVINICDQRALEFTLSHIRPDIKLIRKTFHQLRNKIILNNNKQLFIDGTNEVAVIYYRTAYAPQDFNGDEDWKLRLLLERSKAIKCPSIQYHLSGTKKIQQILANRDVLEKFVSDSKDVNDLLNVFTGLWGLEFDDSGNSALEMALREPHRFVLKPQREGGGYNYFGADLTKKLKAIKNTLERESYIVMDLIKQPNVPNYILMPNKSISDRQFKSVDIMCELGIFGTIIGNESELLYNCEAGHLVRSKPFGINEGGVAAGFGALDSPFLI